MFLGALGLAALAGGLALAGQFQTKINPGSNGTMTLSWDSKAGTNYAVYWAPNLSNPVASWQTMTTVAASNATSSVVDLGDASRPHPTNAPARFYTISEVHASTVLSDILTNTTWNAGGSPYFVSNSIHVRSGTTLTIQAGTRVTFAGGASLTVDGVLRALGTSNQPVVFTSGKSFPARGDWQGLVFTALSTNSPSVLSNAVVQYAQVGVNCTGSSPQLVNSTVQYCSQQGIYLTRSSPLIQGCTIQQNSAQGIYCYDTSSPQVFGNQIVVNGSYGVYLGGTAASNHNCLPVIQGNTLDRNGGYAVYAYNYYQPGQTVIDARSNWWGTADPTQITVRVYDYTDNPTYSPVVNFGNWLGSPGGAAVPGRYVSGQLVGNVVWAVSDSPIGVIGPLLVSSNATLTIQPGVEVDVYGNYALQVDGVLLALGSGVSPVVFTSWDEFPLPGDWQGLVFTALSTNSPSVLSNVVVEYAQVGVNCTGSSPQMLNSTVQYCSQQGIYLTRSSPLIQGCTIQQNSAQGIYCYDTSSPQVFGNQVVANSSYGIYLYGTAVSNHNCLPVIQGNALSGNGTYALYAYNYYQANQLVVDARSNWWGTADALVIAGLVYDYSDNPSWAPVVNFGNWLGAAGGAPAPGRAVSGQILSNTTWQLSDSPIVVIGSLLVTSNATLTIQPGVQVQFYGNYALQVDGALQVLGASNQPVVFTSGKSFPARGDWQGLVFTALSTNSPSVLSNAVVQYAQVGVSCTGSSPQILNSTVQYCSQQGIYLTRSSPLIQGCTIQQNSSYGLYCYDTSSPQVLGNQVVSNSSYGIYLYGTAVSNHNCLPVIQGNALSGNGTYALYAYYYYQANKVVVDARSNWWGTADASVIAGLVYDYNDNPTSSPMVNFGNWLGVAGGAPVLGRAVSGQILSNTTWQLSDSPIAVIGSLLVTSNATLTIQAGVQVQFYGNYALQVDGALQVLGASNQPVVFTSGKSFPARGDWQGLVFTALSTNSPSVLSNAVVQYAQVGVSCTGSSPLIQGCTIQQNSAQGIYCYDKASPQILGNQVVSNSSYGIYLYGTAVSNHNCLPVIHGNALSGNGTYALYAYYYYQANQVVVDARSNWWGTADASVIAGLVYDYNDNPTWAPVVSFGNWLGAAGGMPTPGRAVSGQIWSNTTWQLSDSPIAVVGSVQVVSNATLTIQAGVQAQFYGNYQLQVDGVLQALGGGGNRVIFTSAKTLPQRGDWQGILFTGASVDSQCVLSNSVVEYAQVGVTCTDSSPSILNSWIHYCSQQGIYLTRSSPLIQGNTIERNSSDGIYCSDASSPQILANAFTVNSRYGVNLYGNYSSAGHNCVPLIQGNSFDRNSSYAVYAYYYYQPGQTIIDARSNWWGTADALAIPGKIYDCLDNPTYSPVVNFGNWLDSQGGNPAPGNFVSGQIVSNTVWQLSDSPIGVIGPILVASNATLTIQPGVEVQFYGYYPLQVAGIISALGTTDRPIIFTSADEYPLPGDWQGISFTDTSVDSQCVLSNTVVEYAQIGVNCTDASPRIFNSWVQNCSAQGIYLTRSSPLIQGNTIEYNTADGIYCTDNSSPLILGNSILANSTYGIRALGTGAVGHNSMLVIRGNTLDGNGTYAVYATTYFQPGQVMIDAGSNWWGTADATVIPSKIYDYADNPASSPVVNYGNWLGSSGGTPTPGRCVGGQIVSNTVWQASDSPIGVVGPILVTSNTSLTIQPGVTVQFYGNYSVQVDGTLQALGQSNSPIVFTSGKGVPARGDWTGLVFNAGSTNNPCVLSNVVVQYATIGVNCTATSPQIVNSTVQYCSQQGIYLTRSSPLIQGCTVQQNTSYGIYCYDTSSPQILGNQIVTNTSYGIYLGGTAVSGHNSMPVIQGNAFSGNGTYAVYAYNYYQPGQVMIDASSNWWGTADPMLIGGKIYDYTDDPTRSAVVNFANWLGSPGGAAAPGRGVGGQVVSNTVWQMSDSPITVIGPVLVTSNTSLTIQPGVQVQFYGSYGVQVDGTFQAIGQSNNPIVFSSGRSVPLRGDWTGLVFNAGSSNNPCMLSNVVVQYATVGVNCTATSPQIVNSTVQYCSQQGIYLTRSSPLIQGCTIQQNTSYGIYCYDTSSPQVLGNQIVTNTSYGIYLGGTAVSGHNCLPLIQGNGLSGNGSYAIYSYSYHQPSQVVVEARSNWWGTVDGTLIASSIYDNVDSPTQSPFINYGNWLGAPGGQAVGGLAVVGPISGTTVWGAQDAPVWMLGPVVVGTNAMLTVQAGVEVRVLGAYRLDVNGVLQVLGGLTNKVVFTSGRAAPTVGDWVGIKFLDSSVDSACVVSNAVVEYAQTGVHCENASPTITGCHVRRNTTGVFLDTASPAVANNLIEYNTTGLYCYQNSSPVIRSNTITLNSSYGVQIQSSITTQDKNPHPVLTSNSIFTNTTYDLYAYWFYQPSNVVINAESNWWGTTDTNRMETKIYHRPDNVTYSPLVDYSLALTNDPNFAAFGEQSSLAWFSPNGDGLQDTNSIQASVASAAGWSMVVLNSNNVVARTLTGSGVLVSNAWDGKLQDGSGAPEGRYRPAICATNLADGRVTVSYGDFFWLDVTAPLAVGSPNTLPDGYVANQLVFQGTANDAKFLGYAVDYGAGLSPSSFTLLTTNASAVTSNMLATLNTLTLSNGVYTFRLRAYDYAGNMTMTQWVVNVDNVIISNPDAAQAFFDPGSEQASVSFSLNKASTVTVRVYPVSAVPNVYAGSVPVTIGTTPIRQFQTNLTSGAQAIPWDGVDGVGQGATNGLYVYTISAQAAYGRTNGYAPAYVSGPVTFSGGSVNPNFSFQANDPCAISYNLYQPAFVFLARQDVSNPTYVTPGLAVDLGVHTDYWDGHYSSGAAKPIYYGSFTMVMVTQLLPVNFLCVRRPAAQIISSLAVESYVITPSYSEVSQIRYTLSQSALVTVKVQDPNGNWITVLDPTTMGAGAHTTEWQGTVAANTLVSMAGDYLVSVTAVAAGGSDTKTANISVR